MWSKAVNTDLWKGSYSSQCCWSSTKQFLIHWRKYKCSERHLSLDFQKQLMSYHIQGCWPRWGNSEYFNNNLDPRDWKQSGCASDDVGLRGRLQVVWLLCLTLQVDVATDLGFEARHERSTRIPPVRLVLRPFGTGNSAHWRFAKLPWMRIGNTNRGKVTLLHVVPFLWRALPRGVTCPQCVLALNLRYQVQLSGAAKYAPANKSKLME